MPHFVKGSLVALAAGKKAAKTRRKNLLLKKDKNYNCDGKNRFRQKVIDVFNKSSLTLCLESTQLLFVNALPNCNFIIFEKSKPVFKYIKSLEKSNVTIFYKDVKEISSTRLVKTTEIKQMFLDFCDTFDSNISRLKQINLVSTPCNILAFTFSTRSPSKGKRIGQQHFRMYKTLESIFPDFEIDFAESYSDSSPMIGIIMKRKTTIMDDKVVSDAIYKGILEKKTEELKNRVSFLEFRNLSIKQMILKDDMTYTQIGAQFLPPLCDRQICGIAMKYGIHRSEKRLRYWTESDETIVREKYGKMPLNQLATILRRSTKSVTWKASCMGLKSEIELTNRKKMYFGGSNRRPYTKEEDDYIKTHLRDSLSSVAKALGRDPRSISEHRSTLGLKHILQDGKKRTLWTDADIQFLKDNSQMPIRELEKALNKPISGINTKRSLFGIKYEKHQWTEDEIAILHDDSAIFDKTAKLHMAYNTVLDKMRELDIPYEQRSSKDNPPCPYCGSTNTSKRGKEVQKEVTKQIFKCNDCLKGWRNIIKLYDRTGKTSLYLYE